MTRAAGEPEAPPDHLPAAARAGPALNPGRRPITSGYGSQEGLDRRLNPAVFGQAGGPIRCSTPLSGLSSPSRNCLVGGPPLGPGGTYSQAPFLAFTRSNSANSAASGL